MPLRRMGKHQSEFRSKGTPATFDPLIRNPLPVSSKKTKSNTPSRRRFLRMGPGSYGEFSEIRSQAADFPEFSTESHPSKWRSLVRDLHFELCHKDLCPWSRSDPKFFPPRSPRKKDYLRLSHQLGLLHRSSSYGIRSVCLDVSLPLEKEIEAE